MSRAFLGLGSNEGDRLRLISQAAQLLGQRPGICLRRMAPIIETEPVGGPPQGRYLNTVVEIETALAPRELLAAAQAIEAALGRRRASERWTPRPIDVDVLLVDDVVMNETDLVIPHPRLHERAFVLEPLAQLEPRLVHPTLKKTIEDLRDGVLCPEP